MRHYNILAGDLFNSIVESTKSNKYFSGNSLHMFRVSCHRYHDSVGSIFLDNLTLPLLMLLTVIEKEYVSRHSREKGIRIQESILYPVKTMDGYDWHEIDEGLYIRLSSPEIKGAKSYQIHISDEEFTIIYHLNTPKKVVSSSMGKSNVRLANAFLKIIGGAQGDTMKEKLAWCYNELTIKEKKA